MTKYLSSYRELAKEWHPTKNKVSNILVHLVISVIFILAYDQF